MPAERAATLRTVDPELVRLEFVALVDAGERMRPDIADRLRRAHAALETGGLDYAEHVR